MLSSEGAAASLLFSGWLRLGMTIRAQIARALNCDERDEESQHHGGECNRAEARSDIAKCYE